MKKNREKENASGNASRSEEASTPLKGFHLWMAENKAALSEAEGGLEDESKLQELALAKWKALSKDEGVLQISQNSKQRSKKEKGGGTELS